MLTGDLIQRRINNFWGYGSLEAPVWLVGMEEGLDPNHDVPQLDVRFQIADGKATVDMRGDMKVLANHSKWFQAGAPIQSTWKYPIALYLYLKNKRIPDKEEIRDHQVSVLGDSVRKETCTVELMPLPSQKAHESTWLYANYGIAGLDTREEYLATYKEARVHKLKEQIDHYHPKLVIFFSLTYLPEWTDVIGSKPELVTPQMYFAQSNGTSFSIVPQSRFGMSYKRLYEYAALVAPKVVL